MARMLYSTDASIYQIEPLGVIFPRVSDDLNAIVEICAQEHSPIIVRGAGSGLRSRIGPAGLAAAGSPSLRRAVARALCAGIPRGGLDHGDLD